MPIPFWAAAVPSIIAFLTTFALVPQVRRFAIECRVADKPNGRKVHAHAIPHLGGVAIFGGFFFGLLVSLGRPGGSTLGDRVLALLPALLVVFGLGMVDDLRGLRAGTKLTYQILAASLAVAMGAGFQALGAPGALEFMALSAVGLLWYVGVCNSMNLIDGLDGLAAGTATLASIGFLVVALRVGGYQSVLKDLKPSTRQRFVALSFAYPDPEREAEIVAREATIAGDLARSLVKLGTMTRGLKDSGLPEGASTRLLIQAGKLMGLGIDVRPACHHAISEALTDDPELLKAIDEMVSSVF